VDTEQFFNLVLADEGYICVATLSPADGGRMRHRFVAGPQAAARAVATHDIDPTQVFFGCANYLTNRRVDGDPTQGRRKGDNVQAVRSFWMDLDVEPPVPDPDKPKPYKTAREAMIALAGFETALGLPPSLVLRSGYGLHAYWPMSADMAPGAWKVVATMLKAAALRQGLHADPSRTADIASVLRPLGATHRKSGDREVKLIRAAGQTDVDDFRYALENYLGIDAEADGELPPMPAHIQLSSNSDLTGGMTHAPSFADRIADQCAVMELIRDTRGKVDQPTWYHGLQLLNRCEDGKEKAHDWSKGDSRYDARQVDDILARVAPHGPTLCAKFAEHQLKLCASCPHSGKIKSPIVLGVAPSVPAVITTTRVADPFGTATAEEVPVSLPPGYEWNRSPPSAKYESLCLKIKGEDDKPDTLVSICDALFYPVNRLAAVGGAMMEIEKVDPRSAAKTRFVVETSVIARGSDALASILGKHEIIARPNMHPKVHGYLTSWVTQLAREQDAGVSCGHFGWHDDKFLVGTTMLTPGGGSRSALTHGWATVLAPYMEPKGDLEVWKDIMEQAYNARGEEAFQFSLLCGFAAPLWAMFREYGGITVYAHSPGSGVGKTTAQQAALSIWGDWQELQMAHTKTTEFALNCSLGAFHNLPALYDELTNMTNQAASELVFSITSGKAKLRGTSDGNRSSTAENWQTILMASGNMTLSDKLSQHRGNAEAELVRMFEFTIASSKHLTPNQAASLFPKMSQNYGVAGPVFARYIVDNYEDVRALLLKVRASLTETYAMKSPERFWSALFACVLTAQIICRQLGLVNFPVAPMRDWIALQLEHNRSGRDGSISTPIDLLGTMLSDLWPGILATYGEGDRRNKKGDKAAPATLVKDAPRGQLTGRSITARPDYPERDKLILSISSIKQWCNKNGVSSTAMFDELVAKGWASKDQPRYSLGRGVPEYKGVTSQVKCWILDPDRMGLDTSAATATVSNLKVAGGKHIARV